MLHSVQELAQLQSSHQGLEQQMNQTKTKLTQEIQQSKKEYNVLQADKEKVTLYHYFLLLFHFGITV